VSKAMRWGVGRTGVAAGVSVFVCALRAECVYVWLQCQMERF